MYMNLMKVLSRSYYLQSGNFWKIASVTGIFHQIRMAENHVCLQPCNILSRFAFQCLYQCLREKRFPRQKICKNNADKFQRQYKFLNIFSCFYDNVSFSHLLCIYLNTRELIAIKMSPVRILRFHKRIFLFNHVS